MTLAEYILATLAACIAIFIVPGPIFFLSLSEGARSLRRGFTMLLGVLTAEAILLGFTVVGFVIILQRFMTFLKIGGAALLIILALLAFRSALREQPRERLEASGAPYIKGFTLTFLNPPFILWFITVGASLLDTGLRAVGELSYLIFSAVLLISTVIVTATIVVAAYGGRSLLGERVARVLSLVAGIAFTGIAASLVISILAA